MSEDLLDEFDSNSNEIPGMLNVLTILTFIWSGIMVLMSIYNLLTIDQQREKFEQSMAVLDETNSAFTEGSSNVHIRNGVGILPNGNVLLVISSSPVNLFDFAAYFKSQGCENALYLDGFVSRAFIPQKNWKELDGNFGVIIAQVK
mgnify:CR=1 FL=1